MTIDSEVISAVLLLAGGIHFHEPDPSDVEAALGLIGTAAVIRLFIRSLVRGSGVLGRGS